MSLKPSSAKKIIIGVSVAFVGVIIFFTSQLVGETENWEWFSMDFHERADEISAFGTLLGGILSPLSVLFVLYTVFEQRQQIQEQERKQKEAERQSMLSRLKLISNILISTIDEIESQGLELRIFFNAEKANPSRSQMIYWNTHRNFGRLMNLDFLEMFNAFEEFFSDDPEWNKMLLTLYNLNDFYGYVLADLQKKHLLHLENKASDQEAIAKDIDNLLDMMTEVLEQYKVAFGMSQLKAQPWALLFNDFIPAYYGYLEHHMAAGTMTDLGTISKDLLAPMLKTATNLRDEIGYDGLGSKEVIKLAVFIRKRIYALEMYCITYANDIEKQYQNNFESNNESLRLYQVIKGRIDHVIRINSPK
ncbi:MAG TPA: hypothetical protein VK183_14380 [Flavobacterium sp.]|nr:hypothetical protein [Flavobacterium sp.]